MNRVDPTRVDDVVVVLPGIMGSSLRDGRGRMVWSVSAGSLVTAIRTFGRSLTRLRLPEGIGDEGAPDGVRPHALMDSLHVIPGLWTPITGYDLLLDFLRSDRFTLTEFDPERPDRPANLVPFPYDWRLSNRHNARLLAEQVGRILEIWRAQPGMNDAKLVLICHSMGGLVARWFLEFEGGAEITRTLVTIGTPHRGSAKALDILAGGLDPGFGPFRLRLTPFARSLPSLHQLLPTYDVLVSGGHRVALRGQEIDGLNTALVDDAAAFHERLAGQPAPSYGFHKVVGIRQPTLTTAETLPAFVAREDIDGHRQGGDGTVPRLAAEPEVGRGVEVVEVAEQHGKLQSARATLDLIDGILSRETLVWQAGPSHPFGVRMADVFPPGEQPALEVTDLDNRRLQVQVRDEKGRDVGPPARVHADGTAILEALPEGGYTAVVHSTRPDGPHPVTHPFVVFDEAAVDFDGDADLAPSIDATP